MKNKILFAAFISGMTLMIFEMVGARMIGPYFGTSMYVWSSIIGVIMASLFNQYLAQKVKQEHPSLPVLLDEKAPVEWCMNKLY